MMKVKIIWQGNAISQEEWKIINNCNEIYGACQHKMRFHRFLKEHKHEKYQHWWRQQARKGLQVQRSRWTQWLRWLSGIVTSSSAHFWRHPTSGCPWHLHANPSMCMIIVQQASHLTTTCQPNRELGGSH
jgi:hypothetical protein